MATNYNNAMNDEFLGLLTDETDPETGVTTYTKPKPPAVAPTLPSPAGGTASAPAPAAPAPVSSTGTQPTPNAQLPSNAVAPLPAGQNASTASTGTTSLGSQGFVDAKLQNAELGTTHKYVGGRYLIAHNGDIDGMLKLPEFAGWTRTGKNSVKAPGANGSTYDVINANGKIQWTATAGPAWDKNGIAGVNSLGVNSSMKNDGIKGNYAAANAKASDAARAAGTSTFGYAGTAGGGASGTGGGGIGGGGYGGAVDDAIARLLARGESPVTRETVAAQYDPAAAAIERSSRQSQSAAAERAAFQGTSVGGAGGALDAEQNKIREAAGQDQGQLMSSLITGELQAKRAEVVNAIGFAQGSQKIELQRRLAAYDRELERERLRQQAGQFDADFGLRKAESTYDRSHPPTPVPA